MKVADMHCDTIGEIYENRLLGNNYKLKENNFHVDINKLKKGNYSEPHSQKRSVTMEVNSIFTDLFYCHLKSQNITVMYTLCFQSDTNLPSRQAQQFQSDRYAAWL